MTQTSFYRVEILDYLRKGRDFFVVHLQDFKLHAFKNTNIFSFRFYVQLQLVEIAPK